MSPHTQYSRARPILKVTFSSAASEVNSNLNYATYLVPISFSTFICTIKSAIYSRREHLIMIYLEKACPGRFWRLLCLCLLCKRGKMSLMTAGRELLFVALGIHTAVCLSSAYYSL